MGVAGEQALRGLGALPMKPGPGRFWSRLHQAQMWARDSTWFLTVVGAIVGAGLAVLFVVELHGIGQHWIRGLAWRESVEESRKILASVLGIVITTLSIALSLSLLVLQNTSSNYSPRLLRLFMRDTGSRLLLPVFVATGVYCLVGGYAFGFVEEQGEQPRPALGMAMLLLVCCGAALVFQMTYTLSMVRAEQIVRRVRKSSLEVARALDLLRRGETEASALTAVPSGAWQIAAPCSGFVVDVDTRGLLVLAVARGLFIHLDIAIGEPVVHGASLARLVSEGAPQGKEQITRSVESAVLIGHWREPDKDLALGVRQLVDVAIKALSPGINDPSTAVESVDQLTVLLCELCRLRQGPRVLADAEGRPRVFLRALELGDYLVLAIDQISRYGAGEPAVVLRLLRLVGEVGLRVSREPDQRAVREVLQQLNAGAKAASLASSALVLRYAEEVERALGRHEPLPPLPSLGY